MSAVTRDLDLLESKKCVCYFRKNFSFYCRIKDNTVLKIIKNNTLLLLYIIFISNISWQSRHPFVKENLRVNKLAKGRLFKQFKICKKTCPVHKSILTKNLILAKIAKYETREKFSLRNPNRMSAAGIRTVNFTLFINYFQSVINR